MHVGEGTYVGCAIVDKRRLRRVEEDVVGEEVGGKLGMGESG